MPIPLNTPPLSGSSLTPGHAPIGPGATIPAKALVDAMGRQRIPSGTLRAQIPEPTGDAAADLAARRIAEFEAEQARKAAREAKVKGLTTRAPLIAQPKEDAAQFSGEALQPPPTVGKPLEITPRAPLETIQERVREITGGPGPANDENDGEGSGLDEGGDGNGPGLESGGDNDESGLDEPNPKPVPPPVAGGIPKAPVKPAAKKAAGGKK